RECRAGRLVKKVKSDTVYSGNSTRALLSSAGKRAPRRRRIRELRRKAAVIGAAERVDREFRGQNDGIAAGVFRNGITNAGACGMAGNEVPFNAGFEK
ncbi:MAG: hypothetical protein JW803_07385, partial [Endomicrobiales bacterium]|nr:hypothetical protein [Endomicrobiales bacterium]